MQYQDDLVEDSSDLPLCQETHILSIYQSSSSPSSARERERQMEQFIDPYKDTIVVEQEIYR